MEGRDAEALLDHAPFTPFMEARTARPPGVAPLAPPDWIHVDGAFAAQMALKADLMARRPERVRARASSGAAEGIERAFLAHLLAHLAERADFKLGAGVARRPDGREVSLSGDPLGVAAGLVQEDVCLLDRAPGEAEHRLISACVCFPSRWTLSEKIGAPLLAIHGPVPDYAGDLSLRVQRLFDALREGRPLVRANWLIHSDPTLHQPMGESVKRGAHAPAPGAFHLRVERQCLVKLDIGAAFTIKTCVTPIHRLTPAQRAGLAAALDATSPAQRRYHGGDALHEAARAALV